MSNGRCLGCVSMLVARLRSCRGSGQETRAGNHVRDETTKTLGFLKVQVRQLVSTKFNPWKKKKKI